MRKPKCDILYKKGKIYHVYNRGHHKMKIFRSNDDYSQFIYLMYRYKKHFDIMLISYCLLPNHYHMLLKLGQSEKYKMQIPKIFQSFMTAYCCYFNRKYRLFGSVFQSRFQVRRIENRNDYQSIIEYIGVDPIKANLNQEDNNYHWFYLRKNWNRLQV